MSLRIIGLGTALPPHVIEQSEAAEHAIARCTQAPDQAATLRRLYDRSSVQQRYTAVPLTRVNHQPLVSESANAANGRQNKTDSHTPPAAASTQNTPDPLETTDTQANPIHTATDDSGASPYRAHISDRPNTTTTSPSPDESFYPPPAHPTDRGPSVETRMNAYRTHALPLAAEAACAALDQAQLPADQISQLITVSCTGFSAPGLDVQLIDALGLRNDVGRTMIGFMGCHGALNGLRVARGLAAEQGGYVLLCAVELCSLHFQYGWTPDQVLANALFADGAAALAMSNGQAKQHPDAEEQRSSCTDDPALTTPAAKPHHTDGDQTERNADSTIADETTFTNGHDGERFQPDPEPMVTDTRSILLPNSREDMQWRIGDHGFEMVLSKRVPTLIETHLRPWLTDWLGEHNLATDQIAGWAIHPGGPQVIAAVERALSLPGGAGDLSREILASCGNMSSPTVPFILDRLRAKRIERPWLALAFGPGLVVEGALIQ